MSYRTLLSDRCDVFHMITTPNATGSFGIPSTDIEESQTYSELPDVKNVPCYFTQKNLSISQGDPNSRIIESFKVHFLPNADIRLNDKVTFEGVAYILQLPRKIKNHHYEVVARRDVNL